MSSPSPYQPPPMLLISRRRPAIWLRLERYVVLEPVEVDPAMKLDVGALPDRHRRALLAELGMKAQRVGGQRRVVRLVVDVIPERRQRAAERGVTPVLDRDARA